MKHPFLTTFLSVTFLLIAGSSFAQSPSREELLKNIQAKRSELQDLEKQFLAPSPEDRAAYAEFLTQPDSGLIRLMPREIYDAEVYKQNAKTIAIRGGGAYYSFTRKTHEYGQGSDICLDSQYLSVGFAGADYGMLLKLGDVPINDVIFESPVAHFMASYNPPSQEVAVRQEQTNFGTGVTVNGVVYKTRVPVELDTTYLLRSISFDRTDVLVALRVIRKDTDGSLILAWRLIKKYPKPLLARNN